MEFDDAVRHVEKVIVEEGFSHVATKHLDQMLMKTVDLDKFPRYCIILACGPRFAHAALEISKETGFLFPCSFVVYEDDGDPWMDHVSIMETAAAIGLADPQRMQPVIAMTGETVDACWRRF